MELVLTYTDTFGRSGYTYDKVVGRFTLVPEECMYIAVPDQYRDLGMRLQKTYDYSLGMEVLHHQIDLGALRTICGDPITSLTLTYVERTKYRQFVGA